MSRPPRQWYSLTYLDPEPVLVRLRAFQHQIAGQTTDTKVANLRTRRLRPYSEARQAALLAYLLGQAISRKVGFAMFEEADHDAVFRWHDGERLIFAPVQLKELVPEQTNAAASVEALFEKIASELVDSADLVVGIYVNRRVRFDPGQLPSRDRMRVGEVWCYGAASPDQSSWFLCGDLCQPEPLTQVFPYPAT
jgi:hypothetical protein